MRSRLHRVGIAAIVASLCGLWAPRALAQDEHTVRPGQSLARVARRYHVSVADLAGANRLSRQAQLRPGQVLRIPERGVHYVRQGETLARIARDNDTTVAELRRVNRLREGATLRLGQRLRLPGFDATPDRRRAARRWGEPRHPGVATLYRRTIDRRIRVRMVDARGRARRTAVRRVRELMRPRRHGRNGRLGPAPPRRLIEVLARVSDHFGGRQITITSGYRAPGGFTRASSRHTRGQALDIRVQGVPNTALRDYLRASFRNLGVGFYPRSHAVHVDVRDRNAYWVDWSGPGQRPRYQRRGGVPEDATEEEVTRTGVQARAQPDSQTGTP